MFRKAGFGLVAIVVSLGHLAAQGYPAKPITVVVPWPAGGRTDLTARMTAQFLSEKLGKPVVVANHPGASGVLGAKKVTTATPDGYTIGLFSSGVVATQYTVPAPSDLKDYEPLGLINMDEAVLAVSDSSPFKTLPALVAHARAHPKELKLGTAPGTSAHIMGAQFAKSANVEFLEVPFGGGGARSVALAGKHIDVDIDVPAIYKPMMEAGKVRILGIGAEKRSPLFPEIATFHEQGIDCLIGTWNGLFAPKGTPPEILATVERALESVAKDPRFIELMHRTLLGVRYMDREEFRRFLASEDVATKQITQQLGLHVARQ
jgi:tripartite-type tricarboxylate transporter receptor subunit TctC